LSGHDKQGCRPGYYQKVSGANKKQTIQTEAETETKQCQGDDNSEL